MTMQRRFLFWLAWTLAVALGLSFLASGYPKVIGSTAWVSRFAAWGYPAWFVPVIGVLEIGGGALALVPRTSVYGALAIGTVMLGATFTHLRTDIGSPVMALAYLAMVIGVIWIRRPAGPLGSR